MGMQIKDRKTGEVVYEQPGPPVKFGGDWGDATRYEIVEVPDKVRPEPPSRDDVLKAVQAMDESQKAAVLEAMMVKHLMDS